MNKVEYSITRPHTQIEDKLGYEFRSQLSRQIGEEISLDIWMSLWEELSVECLNQTFILIKASQWNTR